MIPKYSYFGLPPPRENAGLRHGAEVAFDSVGYNSGDSFESFVVLKDSRVDAVSRVLSVEWLEEGDRPDTSSSPIGKKNI